MAGVRMLHFSSHLFQEQKPTFLQHDHHNLFKPIAKKKGLHKCMYQETNKANDISNQSTHTLCGAKDGGCMFQIAIE